MVTLVIHEDVESLLPVLESMKSLKKGTLYPPESQSRRDEPNRKGNEDQYTSNGLCWTELIYYMGSTPISLSLLRKFSSLTRLELFIDFKSFNTVATALHQMDSLNSFYLLVGGEIKNTVWPSGLSPNINVRRLQIHIVAHYSAMELYRGDGNQTIEREGLKNDIPELMITTLLRIMPKVADLTIRLHSDSTCSLFSLEGLFTGHKLSLYFEPESVRELKNTPIPSSVRTLVLSNNGGIAGAFSSKSAKSLKIYQPYNWSLNNEDTPKMRVDLQNWATIEDITIYSGAVMWGIFSLQLLRRVSIDKINRQHYRDTGITSFIKDIACHPSSYPSLEEIDLGECPELDILVIMLEHRNLLQGPEVQKIRKISFRSPCSLEIRQIVSTLLACKWTERPSNVELSRAGNAEILLDLNL
jgi:hypothetical protein